MPNQQSALDNAKDTLFFTGEEKVVIFLAC